MIIKITPENDIERARIKEIEHHGVKEFFIFGNKKDDDGELIDFHGWTGSYRYLVGSLHYFTGMLNDEQTGKSANQPTEIKVQAAPMQMPAQPAPPAQEAQFIKKSGAEDGNVEGIVEIKAENVQETPPLKVVTGEEMEVEEDTPNDSSPGAEEPF